MLNLHNAAHSHSDQLADIGFTLLKRWSGSDGPQILRCRLNPRPVGPHAPMVWKSCICIAAMPSPSAPESGFGWKQGIVSKRSGGFLRIQIIFTRKLRYKRVLSLPAIRERLMRLLGESDRPLGVRVRHALTVVFYQGRPCGREHRAKRETLPSSRKNEVKKIES